MPEAPATETTTTDEPDTGTTSTTSEPTTTETNDWEAEAKKWQGLARKHEERAKANATAAKELDQLRQSSMSDQDKAVAQARVEGEAEGLKKGTSKIVRSEIKAAAAGKLDADQVNALIENVNLASFIDDDGEVDEVKIAKFVDGIAPKPDENTGPTWPDLAQGARGGKGKDDPLLAHVKQIVGSR